MNELPPRMWLVWCCYLAGMEAQQIAYSTRSTAETVRTHIKRARKRLDVNGDRIIAARIPFTRATKETP